MTSVTQRRVSSMEMTWFSHVLTQSEMWTGSMAGSTRLRLSLSHGS